MKMLPAVCVPLVSILVVSTADAQTPAASPTVPPVWSGEGGLSYVHTTGNSDSTTIGGSLKVVHEVAPWKAVLTSAVLRATDREVKTAERLDAGLRLERALGARLSAYAQSSYLRNVFAGIDGQETVEGGGLYKLAVGPKHFLSAGAALTQVWEQRLDPEPDVVFLGGRGTVSYKWHISAAADFTEDVDFLQSFDVTDDWRVGSKAALTASVSRVIGLKVSHVLLHYHLPVPGKKETDATVLASVVAKWPAAPAK
jgi:putative salt-induced outer membrane protein